MIMWRKKKKKQPHQLVSIDLAKKLKMIWQYACELGLTISTVNTIVNDDARLKEAVEGTVVMSSIITTKKVKVQ